MLLLSSQSFGVNNFDIRNNFLSTACVYVCVCLGKRKGEKVIAPHLVYVLVIYLLSAVYIPGNILTFQKLPCHFRNNWPVPCAEQTPRPVDFFFSCNQAAKMLPLFLLLLTMCQHVDVSNNNNKAVL